jgi:cell shape-determining protein MreC
MLKRLLDIYLLFKEYLLFAFCIVTSVALLAMNDTGQIRAIRSFTLTTVGTLQDVFGFLPNYFQLYQENSILRELNLTLSEEVNRLREARLENIRLLSQGTRGLPLCQRVRGRLTTPTSPEHHND